MKGISIFNISLWVSAAALMSACGNIPGATPYSSASALSLGVGSTSSGGGLTSATQGTYQCPAADVNNVTPQYSSASTINGYYQVCVDPGSQQDILVNGSEGNSDQICVFPVQSTQTGTDQEYVYWRPDPNTGAPWYNCQAPSSNGAIFTFQGSNFNSAYIVDAHYATQMQTCLIFGPNTAECPNWPQFSFGVFR